MARKRPTVLTVMGILNIVFGSLGLLCNLCGGAFLFIFLANPSFGAPPGHAANPLVETFDALKVEIPSYQAVTAGSMVASLILSVILLSGGIGLLKVKNWGRVLSFIYSILTVVIQIGGLIYAFAIVNPATERLKEAILRRDGKLPPDAFAMGNSPLTGGIQVGSTLFGMAYAVVLLIMMLLPSVSAAFAAPTGGQDYEMDRQEEEDEYLERERRKREEEQE